MTHRLNALFAALLMICVVAIVASTSGCAKTWEGKTRQAFNGITEAAKQGTIRIAEHCDKVLHDECIAKRLNPCPPLDACHANEKHVIRAAIAAHAAVAAGLDALALKDKPNVQKALAAAQDAVALLRRVLSAYGVTL